MSGEVRRAPKASKAAEVAKPRKSKAGGHRQWPPVNGKALERLRFDKPQSKFSLADIDPSDKPFSCGDKERDKRRVDELALELDELQNVFFADRRYKMLVVLQGMDTSGKDGTLRGVFSRMTPLGVRTVAWKAPSEEEKSHDVLWRIHHQMPRCGEIVVFNRSQYEDVLVPVVAGSLSPTQLSERYRQINDFERMLVETGTVVVKFMLHISRDEQRARLQDRLDDPTKRWKFAVGDLAVRRQWDAYQRAYEGAIMETSTPWAPWVVVPADSKTHRNLMIASVLRDVMKRMDLRFPDLAHELQGIRVE